MAVKASATITISMQVDIAAYYRYYLLQSSTSTKPSKPTENPPGGSWDDSEPTYTEGSTNSLYFVDLTVFSDDTFSYSEVSKSTSYEAAKEAYNKANNAQNSIDNLEIGGRNLFSGYGEEEIRITDYQNKGSYKAFTNHLTFNPCETVGETYTISFWAKSPNGSTPLHIYNRNGDPRHFYFPAKILTSSLGTEWEYFKTTVTNTDRGETYSDSVCNRIEIYAPDQMGVLVKKIKVEKGSKATDWTPAPEDVDSKINDVSGKVAEFIVGTQTAETGSWTGTSGNITALKDGLQINYWLPYDGSGNATLNLTLADGTTTGAKNCYLKGTTRLTTHFAAGSIIKLTYRIDATIKGGTTKYTGWWADPGYAGSDTFDRIKHSSAVKTLDALTKSNYYIMVGTASGYKKAASGVSFDISYPVLAWNHTTAVSADKTTTYMYTSLPGVNLQHNKTSWTGTTNSMAYLVGTLSGTTFTINDTVFASTVPTEVDDLHYIPIGVLYSDHQVYFRSDPTVYAYGSAGFAPISINAKQDADNAFDLGDTANNKADQLIEWKTGAQVDFDLIKGVLMLLAGNTSGDVTLFNQTANGWSFKFTDLNDSINNANSKIDVANADIDTLKEFMNENSEYIDFKTVTNEKGAEEPCIELGVKDSPFKIQITNSRIIFVENDDIPTYIKDGTLNTEKVEVKQEFAQSGFVWKVRSNGNYGLSWKGV